MSRPPALHPLVQWLVSAGLLREHPPGEDDPSHPSWPRAGEAPAIVLLRLAALGVLEGGLSAASGVRADELIGPLCVRMGGAAREVRVLDVREHPVLTLELLWRGQQAHYPVAEPVALPMALNTLLGGEEDVRPAVVLGEWEDALHLWCVPRARLDALLDEALEGAWNLEQLEALADDFG